MAEFEDPKVVGIEDFSRKGLLPRGPKGPHNPGEPPGGDDMLTARVQRLEEDMKELKTDMKNVRDRLAKIEGEISRLPGYPGIAVIVGVIVALGTAAQKFLP